jgi:drug/metabolite transporter (DMT)-like permease
MAKVIIILFIALVCEAIGVNLLSAGLKEIGEVRSITAQNIGRLLGRGATNPKILVGLLLETTFFLLMLVLLKRHDVSLIWPLTSLGFVLTALSARFLQQEQVSPTRWAGVTLIVLGAALVSWSEKPSSPPRALEPGLKSTASPGPK